jgi:phosphoglycolate phosphatase
MSISLVIFDLDGTLIDSARDLAHAVNGMLAGYGCQPLALSEVRAMIGDGMRKLVERALAARGLATGEAAAAEHSVLQRYGAEPVRETVLYPGARAALERLHAAALDLAICTNKPEHLTAAILNQLDLADFFRSVVGGDTLPYRKPDGRVLRDMLTHFSAAPPDALMVGDSEVDGAAAANAGVPLVLMRNGYRRGLIEHIPHLAAIESLQELPALIDSLQR